MVQLKEIEENKEAELKRLHNVSFFNLILP